MGLNIINNCLLGEQYEDSIKKRQEEHINNVRNRLNPSYYCLHDSCPECLGTGIKHDGSFCFHNLSCPCTKCNPTC